jgi:hypothetical protein
VNVENQRENDRWPVIDEQIAMMKKGEKRDRRGTYKEKMRFYSILE